MEILPEKMVDTKGFRSVIVHARTLPDLWWLALREIIRVRIDKQGNRHLVNAYEVPVDRGSETQITENPRRIQFHDFIGYVYEPWDEPRVPILEGKGVSPASQKFVDMYTEKVMTTKKAESEDYTYGEDIVPQTEFCINYLKKHGPNHNHAVIRVGRPETMLEYEKGEGKTTQCLLSIEIKIIKGQMWFYINMRSWDLFGAFSNNLAAFQILKEEMVGFIDRDWCQDGGMAVRSSGLHLYNRDWEFTRSYIPETFRIEVDEREE